jgi:hypothetical protein
MSWSRLRPYLLPLVAALIVLALGVGSTIAAIPTRKGTYYACLTKASGVVTLINYPKEKCATGERLIHWSQQGPAGPAGPQGVQGQAGPADWNAIPNKPAGFADGVDDVGGPGYVSVTQAAEYPIAGLAYATVDTPVGTDVELVIIPKNAPGNIIEVSAEWWERVDAGTLRHFYELYNGGTATTFKVRTRVYNAGIAPAAFKKAVTKVKVSVVKHRPKASR